MKTWKIGDREGVEIIKRNVAVYDRLRGILSRRCAAPGCGYVVSSLIEECFVVPEFGAVCGVCYRMYEALQHPRNGCPDGCGLRNIYYFRDLHLAWKRDSDDTKRRDRLGM